MKMTEKQKTLIEQISIAIGAIATIFVILFCQSCNVTRVITTEAQHYKQGDTTTTIVTKTTEMYNATKNN